MKEWFENKADKYRTRKTKAQIGNLENHNFKPNLLRNSTKRIFWLKVKSNLFIFGGFLLIILGLSCLLSNFIFSVILIIIGIFILIKGKQNKLEYKLRSGHIIHYD